MQSTEEIKSQQSSSRYEEVKMLIEKHTIELNETGYGQSVLDERSRLKGLLTDLKCEFMQLRQRYGPKTKAERELEKAEKLRLAHELIERKAVKKAEKAEQTRLKKNEYNRQYTVEGGEELKARRTAQKREQRRKLREAQSLEEVKTE